MLHLFLGTYVRRNDAQLVVELRTPTDRLIARNTFDLMKATDLAFAPVLPLDFAVFAPGAIYTVLVRWDGSPGNEVALSGWPIEPGSGDYELRHQFCGLSNTRLFVQNRTPPWTPPRIETAVLVVSSVDLAATLYAVREKFPDIAFQVIEFEETLRQIGLLRDAAVVVFANTTARRLGGAMGFDELCFDLHRHGVCTIFFDSEGITGMDLTDFTFGSTLSGAISAGLQQARRCHYVTAPVRILLAAQTGTVPEPAARLGPQSLGGLVASARAGATPVVAVVPLPIGLIPVEEFFRQIINQSYAGRIVAVIGQNSPITEAPNRRIQSLCQGDSLDRVEADIFVFVDGDCLLGEHFVAAHVFEHWWEDVDVVIGPTPVSAGGDAEALLQGTDGSLQFVSSGSLAADPLLTESFINLGHRAYSIKRRHLGELPPLDGVEVNPRFGWDHVAMGYRLYTAGAVFRATDRAVAVRTATTPPPEDESWATGATALVSQYPEMAWVARPWVGQEGNKLSRPSRRSTKRLRILTYRWHASHQYELYKLPHDFTLVTGFRPTLTDRWPYEDRPLRANAHLVAASQVDPRDFDVALMHFDENAFMSNIGNGILPSGWGDVLAWFLSLEALPKIGICHGTPPFVGQYGVDPYPKTTWEIHEQARRFLVNKLAAANTKVVCNSYQAELEWGFVDSRVIWHGFDPIEFPPATLQRDVLTLSRDNFRPHYRGAWEQDEVISLLAPGVRTETASHGGASLENRESNAFAVRQFRSYVDRIRQFKVYLSTTLRSPMPRSRGEAMMTGVIPVSLRNHDVDLFIENGVDGFYDDQPTELAKFINDLLRDHGRVAVMSNAARRKALDVFNHARYLHEWEALLHDTVG
jgi:hypothetical protein